MIKGWWETELGLGMGWAEVRMSGREWLTKGPEEKFFLILAMSSVCQGDQEMCVVCLWAVQAEPFKGGTGWWFWPFCWP